jgi:hypothetical protein
MSAIRTIREWYSQSLVDFSGYSRPRRAATLKGNKRQRSSEAWHMDIKKSGSQPSGTGPESLNEVAPASMRESKCE